MTIQTYNPFVGTGRVSLRKEGVAEGLLFAGNVRNLKPTVSETEKKLPDYTKPGGGTYASLKRIESVSVSFDLLDLTPRNLAQMLFGSASTVDAGTVAAGTPETVTAYAAGLVRLAHINPTSVVVKSADGNTTYDLNDDYTVSEGGINIVAGGAISAAAAAAVGKSVQLQVTYAYAAHERVEAMTEGAGVYHLVFEGINEGNGNKAIVVDIWRVNLGALKELLLIGDDFTSSTVTGECLAATSKGNGLSKYLRMDMEQ